MNKELFPEMIAAGKLLEANAVLCSILRYKLAIQNHENGKISYLLRDWNDKVLAVEERLAIVQSIHFLDQMLQERFLRKHLPSLTTDLSLAVTLLPRPAKHFIIAAQTPTADGGTTWFVAHHVEPQPKVKAWATASHVVKSIGYCLCWWELYHQCIELKLPMITKG